MEIIDIIKIDNEIQQSLKNEISKIPEYKETYNKLSIQINRDDISKSVSKMLENTCNEITEKIKDIETNSTLNFYIAESSELINRYKEILNTPLKMNFTGKPIENNILKQNIIEEYLDIIKKYTSKYYTLTTNKKKKITCNNCKNTKKFEIIDIDTYICSQCCSQQNIFTYQSTYRDSDRVNISSKYEYDRKIHFRDCINQYQGKQNSTVESYVYDNLEEQFKIHYLLEGNENSEKEVRFKRITKEHIMMFLKELGYTKHYENVNLIHYTLTGKKPDDISYLEDKLIHDFDLLTELYDKMYKHIERKNFINTMYVLYQLLVRHKHPCKKEDFPVLKTTDRKNFHDEITKELFEQLGWNHQPFY